MAGAGAAKLKDHLSYLERDATQRDASPGKLYGSLIHDVDTESFRDRCKGNRHHFRFIVSPEDAEQMADLKAFTRELVSRMESDLGTKLDWVAVDHYDTVQPHTHLLVRGVRDVDLSRFDSGLNRRLSTIKETGLWDTNMVKTLNEKRFGWR